MSPPTTLENLSGPNGSLKVEPPDAAEIAGLLRTGSTRLNENGFRPSNRYIFFQALPHTLGLGPEVWRVLDLCHNKRKLGGLQLRQRHPKLVCLTIKNGTFHGSRG